MDRGGHRPPGDGDAHRLRDLAESALNLCREIVECGVNRRRIPPRQASQLLAHFRQSLQRITAQMLGSRLSIHLDAVDEEETAVLCHLLQSLGAFAPREDHALEQVLIAAVYA